jgi:hypothetical protein
MEIPEVRLVLVLVGVSTHGNSRGATHTRTRTHWVSTHEYEYSRKFPRCNLYSYLYSFERKYLGLCVSMSTCKNEFQITMSTRTRSD